MFVLYYVSSSHTVLGTVLHRFTGHLLTQVSGQTLNVPLLTSQLKFSPPLSLQTKRTTSFWFILRPERWSETKF